MSNQLTRRVEAHRDYLDDMLRSLGYARADLLGADRNHNPALPVACATCHTQRDCAAWLDATVADGPVHRADTSGCADDAVQAWPRFCPNREAVRDRLRGSP